jgi:hypothetical protein
MINLVLFIVAFSLVAVIAEGFRIYYIKRKTKKQ